MASKYLEKLDSAEFTWKVKRNQPNMIHLNDARWICKIYLKYNATCWRNILFFD